MVTICLPLAYNQWPHFSQLQLWSPDYIIFVDLAKYLRWIIHGLFFFILVYSKKFSVNKCSIKVTGFVSGYYVVVSEANALTKLSPSMPRIFKQSDQMLKIFKKSKCLKIAKYKIYAKILIGLGPDTCIKTYNAH